MIFAQAIAPFGLLYLIPAIPTTFVAALVVLVSTFSLRASHHPPFYASIAILGVSIINAVWMTSLLRGSGPIPLNPYVIACAVLMVATPVVSAVACWRSSRAK